MKKQELLNKELDAWYVSERVKSPQEHPISRMNLKAMKSQDAVYKDDCSDKLKKHFPKNETAKKSNKAPNRSPVAMKKEPKERNVDQLSFEERKNGSTKEDEYKKEVEELERKYMEEGYDLLDDSLEGNKGEYNFLDNLTESKAMDAMINKLYAEMPDLQNSCEQSQRDNIPPIYCNDSQEDSEDLCNYGISPMINTKLPDV